MLMWLILQGPGSGGLQLVGLILAVLVAILVGVIFGYLAKTYKVRSQIESAEIEVSKMTSEAETKAKSETQSRQETEQRLQQTVETISRLEERLKAGAQVRDNAESETKRYKQSLEEAEMQ